jgi:hypothetical protein
MGRVPMRNINPSRKMLYASRVNTHAHHEYLYRVGIFFYEHHKVAVMIVMSACVGTRSFQLYQE